MVFFELVNIELMLDTTHDPIADFIVRGTAGRKEEKRKKKEERRKKKEEKKEGGGCKKNWGWNNKGIKSKCSCLQHNVPRLLFVDLIFFFLSFFLSFFILSFFEELAVR